MSFSLCDLFRILSSFELKRINLHDAPWERYVEWAVVNGLAPLAAYNIEYRLLNTSVPDWARDRLLSTYQGTANDNVMKLLSLKRICSSLEGRQIALLGAAAFAESLYPHVAFRPVIDVRMLLHKSDLEPFSNYLCRHQFRADSSGGDLCKPDLTVTDTHMAICLHGSLLDDPIEEENIYVRSLALKVYGPSIRQLELEDALLVHVLLMARACFQGPLIELIDLRELMSGAPQTCGLHSRPLDFERIRCQAKAWKMERALYAALSLIKRFFPEFTALAEQLQPALLSSEREAIDRLVVIPKTDLDQNPIFQADSDLTQLFTPQTT